MTAYHSKPSRMNVRSTAERIYLFNLALDVNDHERDEIFNELMHHYIRNTLESDATSVFPYGDAVDRVCAVFPIRSSQKSRYWVNKHSCEIY